MVVSSLVSSYIKENNIINSGTSFLIMFAILSQYWYHYSNYGSRLYCNIISVISIPSIAMDNNDPKYGPP